jgi:hypothetical protein
MMLAATAEQAWTVNLLSAALYQSVLFLTVFKLLVRLDLTRWLEYLPVMNCKSCKWQLQTLFIYPCSL